jgi:hypothetical protein
MASLLRLIPQDGTRDQARPFLFLGLGLTTPLPSPLPGSNQRVYESVESPLSLKAGLAALHTSLSADWRDRSGCLLTP